MEESHKGVSSTSGAKKKSSLDDDIGADFLTSWKPTTNGEDGMDFTAETPSKARKTKFDFDKLDDFEFGEDFGKMSSFKMDMPDLDFSSPCKRPEDPKQKLGKDPVHGKDGKQGLFSFNFDFNELESFGIDSNLLKGDEKSNGGNKRLDYADDKGNAPYSKCNSTNSTSIVQNSPKNASKSNEAIGSDSGKRLRHMDAEVASQTTHPAFNEKNTQELFVLEKEITVTQGNNTKKKKSDGCIEQPDMMTSGNLQAWDDSQVFSVPSSDKLALEIVSECHSENVGNLPYHVSIMRRDKSAESLGSPDSRSSSCVKTSNLGYPPTCVGESSDDTNKFEAHLNNQNEAIKERTVDSGIKPTHAINVENAPISTFSSKTGYQTKSSDDNCSSSPMNPPSSLRDEHRFKKHAPVSLEGNAFKPLSKLEVNISTQSYALDPKPNSVISTINIERLHLTPVNEKREPSTSSRQVLRKVCLNEGANKEELSLLGYDRNKKDNPISIATKHPNNHKNPVSCFSLIGGHALLKPSIGSIEKSGVSLKSDARCSDNSLKISRLRESTTPLANSTNKRKSNLLSISDIDAESRSRKTPNVTLSEITEKPASSSLSLKRRSFQGLTADPTTLKSIKRFPQSPAKKRNCMDKPVNIGLHSVFNSEELVDRVVDVPLEPQQAASVDMIPSEMAMLDLEVPIVLEDDGHVQKAEACAKELDDIFKMLKKKHEEAKEVLVRAVVNTNHLLMLNHPINEENICSLQRLTRSLISMEFE